MKEEWVWDLDLDGNSILSKVKVTVDNYKQATDNAILEFLEVYLKLPSKHISDMLKAGKLRIKGLESISTTHQLFDANHYFVKDTCIMSTELNRTTGTFTILKNWIINKDF